MAGTHKQNRVLIAVGVGTALSMLVVYWLARLLREEEEFEQAVRVPPVRPEEVNIPIPLDTLVDADEPPEPPAYETVAPGAVVEEPPVEAAPPAAPSSAAPAKAESSDDLTRIDGIGPKYAQALEQLGIVSFARLGEQVAPALAEQLRAQGVRIIGARIESEDWIGQARQLAAER